MREGGLPPPCSTPWRACIPLALALGLVPTRTHALAPSLPPPQKQQVDAKHVELRLDEVKPEGVVNEAAEQIAYADRIVLNKTDLVRSGGCCCLCASLLSRGGRGW